MCSMLARCVLISFFAILLPGQSENSRETSAIKEVIQSYLDARDRRDAKALAELFMADADQLVSTGEWRRGRDAVVRGTLASSEATGGHRSITIQTIRYLTPSVALADGPYELSGLAGGQNRKMWTTFVLKQTPEGWRIGAIRNMRPAAPPPSR